MKQGQSSQRKPLACRAASQELDSARLHAIVDASIDLLWVTSVEGKMKEAYKTWSHFTGQELGEMAGKGWLNVFHQEDREPMEQCLMRTVASSKSEDIECRVRRHDDTYRIIQIKSVPVVVAGETREWMGIGNDITEQKLLDLEMEERMRLTLAAANVGMWEWDMRDGSLVWTDQCRKLFGLSPGTPLDYPVFSSLIHPQDQQRVQDRVRRSIEDHTEYEAEYRAVWPDGSIHWISALGRIFYNEQNIPIRALGVSLDVSEHKRIEGELRRLEKRTHRSLDALLLLAEEIVHLPENDERHEHRDALPQRLVELICGVLGCARAAITTFDERSGRPHSAVMKGISEEIVRQWKARAPHYAMFEVLSGTPYAARLEEGEVIVVDMRDPIFREMGDIYQASRVLVAPMVMEEKLQGMLVLDYGSDRDCVYSENDIALARAVAQLVAFVLERKNLLSERAEAWANILALRATNRMMDDFLGIAGHELRTPLTATKGSVQLAQRRLGRLVSREPLTTEAGESLSNIQELLGEAERQMVVQARLISDLLDVSRIQAGRMEMRLKRSNLVEVVRESIKDQRYLAPERRLLLTDAPQEEIWVVADEGRIHQVIGDYFSNAVKYSDYRHPIVMRIELSDQRVRVLVQDKGPGLAPEDRQRIWDLFYRIPGVEVRTGSGVGLGIGLHICRTIIELHGGQVGVESEEGRGSTFWFSLPLAE